MYVKRKYYTESRPFGSLASSSMVYGQVTTYTHTPSTFAFHSKYSSINKAKAKCVELKLMDEHLVSAQVRRLGNVLFRV